MIRGPGAKRKGGANWRRREYGMGPGRSSSFLAKEYVAIVRTSTVWWCRTLRPSVPARHELWGFQFRLVV